jgi:hypothetical protein
MPVLPDIHPPILSIAISPVLTVAAYPHGRCRIINPRIRQKRAIITLASIVMLSPLREGHQGPSFAQDT